MNKIIFVLLGLFSVNVYANDKLLENCLHKVHNSISGYADEMLACNQIYGKPKLDLNNRIALRHIHWCFQNTVHSLNDDVELMKCIKQIEE